MIISFQDKNVGVKGVRCETDNDCSKDTPVVNGNGFRTGKCNTSFGTCEINAWCPTEVDKLPK